MNRPNLYYDIEAYHDFWCVVFMDDNLNYDVYSSEHSFNTLLVPELKELIKSSTLIGFNNYSYDDIILQNILKGFRRPKDLKDISDNIIIRKKKYWSELNSFDLYANWGYKNVSLKKCESALGLDIEETEVPFDQLETSLEERLSILNYCKHDVFATREVYLTCADTAGISFVDKLQAKKELREEFGINLNWGNSAVVKRAYPKLPPYRELKIMYQDLIKDPRLIVTPTSSPTKTICYERNNQTVCHKIDNGSGGGHGINENLLGVLLENVYDLDGVSLYPSLMEIMFYGTGFQKVLTDLKTQRIEMKAKGITKQLAYKILINATFGNFNFEQGWLYDPKKSLSVTLSGQNWLNYLFETINKYYLPVQENTDGVMFILENEPLETTEMIMKKVKEETGIELELTKFDKFMQMNVNNYVGLRGDKVIIKGGYVGNYHGNKYQSGNNLAIVDKMVVNKILFNKEFSDTLSENQNAIDYQITTHCSSKFNGVIDDRQNEHQKTNRLFATTMGLTRLSKYKEVNGCKKLTSYGKLPDYFTIYNKDIKDTNINDLDLKIDYKYYIDLAQEHYNEFIGNN